MAFNPTQLLVSQHYIGGEFAQVTNEFMAGRCGDGLFTFLINEAGDAENLLEFQAMLENAIDQLRSLQGELFAWEG